MTGPNGVYYVQNFNIVLLCGMTELQAQLSWTENVRYVGCIIRTTVVLTRYALQGVEKR